MKNLLVKAALAVMAAGALVAGLVSASAPGNIEWAMAQGAAQAKTLKVEVAEDMSRFVFDKSVTFEDGLPKHGSSFITQGYIYPAGTLKNGEDGVNKDGTPKYADKVMGEWTCRGWFVGEGAHAKKGPMVVTTQMFSFGKVLGQKMIVTDGYELADIGVAISRAITGGTGEYMAARGELKQTFLGFNATEGVNLSLEFKLSN
jgi:hypothetical protein